MGKVKDGRSYAEQFADLKGATDPAILKVAHPRPSQDAQSKTHGASRVPFTKDIYVRREQRPLVDIGPDTMSKEAAIRKLNWIYFTRWTGFISMHAIVFLVCPFYFSWTNLAKGMLVWFFTGCLGICMCFHRQLTHRSFKTPKWLEYTLAFLGTHGYQGPPQEWVSNHRAHHLHTDTPLDPHSAYEGFYWSFMGWWGDVKAKAELAWVDYSNATDLTSQWFYRFLEATWFPQFILRFALTQYYLGVEGICWTLAWPLVYGWHVAFLVNSAGHLWGSRPYVTDDLSTNCWWASWLTLGECWHNTHHAFPYSAKHGFEWWEVDVEFAVVRLLEALGLAWDIKIPTDKQMVEKLKPVAAAGKADGVDATVRVTAASDGSDSDAGSASDSFEADAVVRPAIGKAGKAC